MGRESVAADQDGEGRSSILVVARVYCARCKAVLTYTDTSRSLMAYYLRHRGWSDTKRDGWVCAACLAVEREQHVARRS